MTKILSIPSTKTITAFLLFFVFSSCTKDTSNLTSDEEVAGSPSSPAKPAPVGGGGSLTTISLAVTVSNTTPDGSPSNITNDGKGNYLNGVDYVQAVLDQYGTFAFNTLKTNTKNALAKRWVNYNFNNPVDPGNTYRPSPSNSKNYHFSTGGSTYGTQPFIPIQNLGVNGNPSSECIYMGNGIYNSTTTWTVSFHKGAENTATSPTGFAVVTRTKIKAVDGVDEWTVTAGSCSATPNTVASLRSGTNTATILHGYYYLPYFFTLRAL